MNFKNILVTYFKTEKVVTFTINWDIVDMVIGGMLFNINNKESILTCEWAWSIFKLFENTNNDQIELNREQDLNRKAYKVDIHFSRCFIS